MLKKSVKEFVQKGNIAFELQFVETDDQSSRWITEFNIEYVLNSTNRTELVSNVLTQAMG